MTKLLLEPSIDLQIDSVLSAVLKLHKYNFFSQNIVLINWYKSLNISKIIYFCLKTFFSYKNPQANEAMFDIKKNMKEIYKIIKH